MGIDRPDIEAVVHAAPMIAYAQTGGCLRAAILRRAPRAERAVLAIAASRSAMSMHLRRPGALPRSTVADSVTGGLSPVRRICNHQ